MNTVTVSSAAAEANATLIRSGYEAFGRGDVAGALDICADDILWHVPGRGPLSRDYRGPQDVLSFFGLFISLSGGTFRIRLDDILANDDKVVVLCTESAERAGCLKKGATFHDRTRNPAADGCRILDEIEIGMVYFTTTICCVTSPCAVLRR